MPFSLYKKNRIRVIFLVYWSFLAYIIAALVWWFIALNQLNVQLADYETSQLKPGTPNYHEQIREINAIKKRKSAQYIGEGSIFFLLILSGAVFIYRAVRRQFNMGREQQNFMMAITHELKTPIAITKLNLETLQKRKLEESQQQRLIQNTIQETNRLNALCNNMLLASQMDAGRHSFTNESINLSGLVNDCVDEFINRYPKRAFNKQIEESIFIKGDLLMLQMAVNNLIDNAIKYSPKDSPISILLTIEKHQIKLSIRDEGKGIEAAEKQKVFDKFYRVGNEATKGSKGTGLGLYLTKKIAARHKGNIFVTDNHPTGSNFTIVFEQSGNQPG